MIRKTLTALALAAGFAVPAFANATHDIDTQDVYFTPMSPTTGLDTAGAFGVDFDSAGAFDEVFRFMVPPTSSTSQVSFLGFADDFFGLSISSVDFGVFNYERSNDDFSVFYGVNVTSLATTNSLTLPFAFFGQSQDYLGSGIYYIEVKGTALADSSGFGGYIFTTAIPEPGNVALLLAGLGIVGGVARRRKQAA